MRDPKQHNKILLKERRLWDPAARDPPETACLNQSCLPFFMSTAEQAWAWTAACLENSTAFIRMDLRPLFSSWKLWAIRQLRQIQSLVETPNSLSNGPQKRFLGFYSLLPAAVGFLFSPASLPRVGFWRTFVLLSCCTTSWVLFFSFFFLPQFTNPGDIFAHVHSNGKTVRILAPKTFVNYWLCKKPLRLEDCKQAAWGRSMLNQGSK